MACSTMTLASFGWTLFILLNALNTIDSTPVKPCVPKWFNEKYSFVCVCNQTYCDSFDDFDHPQPYTINKFTSDSKSHRFVKSIHKFQNNRNTSSVDDDGQTITIDRNQTFQTIIGFGAAFTDATGINIGKFSKPLLTPIIEEFYGPNGLRFTMGRVPIGGTDFSTKPYTLDDNQGGGEDLDLKHFKLAPEDFEYKIPLIKQAMNVSEFKIKLFASPWSPPAWMKTNGRLNHKGHIKGATNGSYYKSYANYLVRFLQEYQQQGIDFWGLTLQNVPTDGSWDDFPFNCNGMLPEEQRDFIIQTIGPLLNSSGFGLDVLKLMIMDDNRPFMANWANVVLTAEEAKNFIAGIAFHWYLNKLTSPDVLEVVREKFPDYFLLSTEACEGWSPFEKEKVSLGNWLRAESYSYDIITNLNHHTSGWIDWNMVLDMQGGPNWVANFVDATIIIDADKQEYYKQPMYYALAHFTRFLKPESIRIGYEKNAHDYFEIAVFSTPENSTVMIVMNRFHDTIPLHLIDPKYGTFVDKVMGHSIQTYVWF